MKMARRFTAMVGAPWRRFATSVVFVKFWCCGAHLFEESIGSPEPLDLEKKKAPWSKGKSPPCYT